MSNGKKLNFTKSSHTENENQAEKRFCILKTSEADFKSARRALLDSIIANTACVIELNKH
ncbi:hypothetical protein U0D24_21665 [Hafnia paralvei]|jgi:hypothetical protein|uniref:hypothetical protein n=1 Tax=Hafnia paralvei TaxID=546367 RepID=UPI002FDC5331